MNKSLHLSTITALMLLFGLLGGKAMANDWQPTGSLASINVVANCIRTGGDIAVARAGPPRTIFYCPSEVVRINNLRPGAGHFFFVHEYGHHALNTSDEVRVDCWAARQMVSVGAHTKLRAAISYFDEIVRGTFHPLYGSGFDRAQRLRTCSDLN